jgi:hypothetical protein
VSKGALTESISTRMFNRGSMKLYMHGVHRRPQGVCERFFDSKYGVA